MATNAGAPLTHFLEFATALRYVERALRQLARAQGAHQAHLAERERLGFKSGRVPQTIVALDKDFHDAMTFAISAARQAVRARTLLAKRGADLPEVRQADAVIALRDLDEHWDEWRTRPHDGGILDDDRWTSINAGRRWAQIAGVRPEGHMRYRGEGVDAVVENWCGIEIGELTKDLQGLRDAIRVLEVQAFEWELLDEASARAWVGDDALFEQVWPWVPRAAARDEVVRARRSALAETLDRVRRAHPNM